MGGLKGLTGRRPEGREQDVAMRISGRSSKFYQSILVGADQQFLAVRDAHLIEDTREVMADGCFGDTEPVGDVAVGEPLTDEPTARSRSVNDPVPRVEPAGSDCARE